MLRVLSVVGFVAFADGSLNLAPASAQNLPSAAAAQPPAAAAQPQGVAQPGHIAVAGRITNARGNGVPSATISIAGNGARTSVQTDANGNYSFSLAPGFYTISVIKGGYQSASSDVTVLAGTPVMANVILVEANLSNLQVIGRTSGSGTRNQARFNVSSSSDAQINSQVIENRTTPDLTPLVNELPGVTVAHSATQPNENFIVRGLSVETKTTIDGHPVSSGTSGTFLTQFMSAPLFGGVDVLKGAGLNGPTAGQSAVGTVNIRTLDFTPKDSSFFQVGSDSYGGTVYTTLVDLNFLKDNRLSLILGRSFSGYRGPTYNKSQIGLDNADGTTPAYTGTFQTPALSNNVAAFVTDFSNTYSLNAELAKLRYRFSDQTSLMLEFLGLQGRYDPQGGSYGQFSGYGTVPNCLSAAGSKGVATTSCGVTSVYSTPQLYGTPTAGGAPFYTTGMAGATNVPFYAFYPGSDVRQNQPNFSADFTTTYKDATILFRPYTAAINRLIDGGGENGVPGNYGGWYQVTSNANCQVQYAAASAANGGAKGPCYVPGVAPSAGYVTNPSVPHAYATTGALPNGYVCSAATPCLTTPGMQDNAGEWGFGSPYTTLELDKLLGYTFDFIKPVGNNTYNFSVDHYYDDAQSYLNDASSLIAGCSFTEGSVVNTPAKAGPGYQPGCTLPNLRPSPIGVPETFSSITGIALTGQFQLTPKLEFDWGNYFTHYTILAQKTNPALSAIFGANTSAIPLPSYNGIPTLVGNQLSASHYDPHFGFVFRPTREWAIRATAGSSISIPFASQVSGFTKINQSSTGTTFTTPNNSLLPEEVVAFDLGSDYRLRNGTVLAADIYNDDVHNAWINTSAPYTGPTVPGLENTPNVFQSQYYNVPHQVAQGIEFSATNEPARGLGYRLTTSFARNYYLGIPPSFFSVAQYDYNGEQIVGIPYAKGYAEIQYAAAKGTLFRLGADYEGNNNAFNYPAFLTFDGGVRVNLSHGVVLGTSVENLTGVNFGANLGHAVQYQGVDPVAARIVNGQYVYTASKYLGIVQPGFRTFRFTLSKRI